MPGAWRKCGEADDGVRESRLILRAGVAPMLSVLDVRHVVQPPARPPTTRASANEDTKMDNERYPEGTCQQCGGKLNDKDAEDGLCPGCIVENLR